MSRLQRKAIGRPDETRKIPHGRIEMFDIGDATVAWSSFEPGWRWSTSVQPMAGTEYCEFHHLGYSISGRARVRTREGAELEIGPGEFHEIPPFHDAWVVGDEPWVSIDWGGTTGYGEAVSGQRVVVTLLFTDIVDSTVQARALGDSRWRDRLARHNALIRSALDRFRGREVTTTGDGFLAVFDSAERAVRAAQAMIAATPAIDLEIRAAAHTGEVELDAGNVRGLAVHVAARILGLAGPGELLVSATTRELLADSSLQLVDRGTHELKGVPGPRTVHAVVP